MLIPRSGLVDLVFKVCKYANFSCAVLAHFGIENFHFSFKFHFFNLDKNET